jgi:hypothetical protein
MITFPMMIMLDTIARHDAEAFEVKITNYH